MKVNESRDFEENISTELSDESKFIKSILLKAKSGAYKESLEKQSNIKSICEDFNSGRIVLLPMNEHDVILAYNSRIDQDGDSGVVITGHSSKDRSGPPNVTIKLTTDEFFRMLSVN